MRAPLPGLTARGRPRADPEGDEQAGQQAAVQVGLRLDGVTVGEALHLTGDPMIGLKLGEPFIPQRYGLFGYALLSAPTLRRAMSLAVNFGQLTFSFFSFEFGEQGDQAWFAMKDPPAIEPELHDVYLDRDMAAAVIDFSE